MGSSRKGKAAGKGAGQAKAKQKKPAADLDTLFAELRSGAANVAGVTYQVSLSAMLLAAGRAGTVPSLLVTAVIPENLEDIDCQLVDGSRLLVQSKERGPGAANIAAAELAEILAHAALSVKLSDEALGAGAVASRTRLAVVTNGSFGSSLPVTGWTQTLDTALAELPNGATVRQTLLTALQNRLEEAGLDQGLAPVVVERSHLVRQDAPGQDAVIHLRVGLGLHPALAALLRSRLQCDLAEVAALQRQTTFATAVARTVGDLDVMATRLAQEVNVDSLEEAIAAGVCEPLDFLARCPQDARGFYEGVSVMPNHIAAGLDVVRPVESRAVLSALYERGQVVISGPSGSGKSALLWRCARLIEAGTRLLRVVRVETSADAELLFRHVLRSQPTEHNRIVVCIDDLGRARTGAWAQARDRLLELPGVRVLAAARQEDITPSLSREAVIVDARLTPSAAEEIYQAVQASGVPVEMAREEAIALADGLLMEFLALVTTGRRLRKVLAEQVDRLDEPQRQVDRELLRLVCAAHALGFETPSETLPAALSRDPVEVESALRRLLGEHMLTNMGAGGFRGLHDLRTEVLLELLHERGHPVLGSTFAAAVMALGPTARPQALRRAAIRVARACARDLDALEAGARLTQVHFALRPLAQCVAAQLRDCTDAASHGAAARVATLMEVADRFDTIAHVYACLPVVDAVRPAHLDRTDLLRLAWMATDGMDISKLPKPNILDTLVPLLPGRAQQAANMAGEALGADRLSQLLHGAALRDAVRLSESAETLIALSREQAGAVYRQQVPRLPHHPGSDPGVPADLRAQLTASLAVLAGVRGAAVAEVFGDVEARAADAVASNLFGCRVEVAFTSAEQLRAMGESSLARPWTYSAERACTARVVSYARLDETPVPDSAYAPEPGEDPRSENSQIVLLIRRVFDACPEADLVHAELWQADGRPRTLQDATDGVKNIRAGVLRRARATGRHVALRAVALEAEGNESWTRRCRAQAELSRDLLELLSKLPDRLRPRDSAPARHKWTAQVRRVHEDAAVLPPRPTDPAAPLSPAEAESLTYAAALEDRAVLEAAGQDAAKKALAQVASCLRQVAHSPEDTRALRGAGARLLGTVPDLERAIAQGAPVYAGIGDTMPGELAALVQQTARLLSAVEEPLVCAALRRGASNRPLLEGALHETMQGALDSALRAVTDVLGRAAVTPVGHASADDPEPAAAWLDRQVVVAVPVAQWLSAGGALRTWAAEQREQAGLRCRVSLVPVDDNEVLPFSVRIDPSGPVLPAPEDRLSALVHALGLPLRGRDTQAALTEPAKALRMYSYDLVRRANRSAGWAQDPVRPRTPDRIAEAVALDQADILAHRDSLEHLPPSEQARLLAVQTLLEVCGLVADEDGQGPGLISGFASLDITNLLIPQEFQATAKLNFAFTAAIEADRAQPPTSTATNR